ncbi:MAG: hypothetical protein QW318_06380 [Candidatus Caldarchaeum sp.]
MVSCKLKTFQGQALDPAPTAAVQIEPWQSLQQAVQVLGEEGLLKAAWDSYVIDIQNAGRRVLAEAADQAIRLGQAQRKPDGAITLPPEVLEEAARQAAEEMAAYARGERKQRATRPSKLASKLASLDKASLLEALKAAEAGDVSRLVALLS